MHIPWFKKSTDAPEPVLNPDRFLNTLLLLPLKFLLSHSQVLQRGVDWAVSTGLCDSILVKTFP